MCYKIFRPKKILESGKWLESAYTSVFLWIDTSVNLKG